MLASQLLDLLQGQAFGPGVCRMGLQVHRSVLAPTFARSWDQRVDLRCRGLPFQRQLAPGMPPAERWPAVPSFGLVVRLLSRL